LADDARPVFEVLDEKRPKGKPTLYLVDWESDPVTGDIFQPSWVRALAVQAPSILYQPGVKESDVGKEALGEWREKAKRR
jgi:hypothetical protein